VLEDQFASMAAHVRRVESKLSPTGLWDTGFQFGDWLDPTAPPEDPLLAKADPGVVATACLFRSASLVAETAALLGHADEAHFRQVAEQTRAAFVEHYLGADGRITSDAVTVYALAIAFGLLDAAHQEQAGTRLAELVREGGHHIQTGFAGTPFVTDALTVTGHLDDAYALLLQKECPSWLYPVTMGATTVWERWDSMLPDGTINPGQMTSFNHYALGAVVDWLHRTVAGLAPLEPGYARVLVAPQPGGGLTWARTSLQTPHGPVAVSWSRSGDGGLALDVTLPEGVTGVVRLPGEDDQEIGSGAHHLTAQGALAPA
jgi:alpha-L-rhamnosidase